jgi:flagellin-like hook-associated protein FlgL
MPITDVQKAPPGAKFTWGFDTDSNQWVPVDVTALEGSTVGNLARGAGRGAESIYRGVEQFSTGGNQAALAELEARSQAAEAGAPIAERIGQFAPEALASVGAAAATGGMGFIPALAAESLAGGAVSALRPGTFEERMAGALESAGLNLAGGVAAKGVLSALRVGRGILGATQSRVAAGVEAGAQRVDGRRQAEALAAGENAPGSVGAAKTPASAIDEGFAAETGALEQTEKAGADITTKAAASERAQAEAHGYRSPLGAGTRQGSPARLAASVREMTPLGDVFESQVKADNQSLLSRTTAEGLGLPNPAEHTSISVSQLADAEQASGSMFEAVKSELPPIGASDYVRTMEGISQKKGPAGRSAGQKIINDSIETAKQEGGVYDGEQIMQTRAELSARMADMFAKGDTSSGEVLMRAIAKLDDLIENVAKRRGPKGTVEKWEKARSQWQLLSIVKKPGVISNTGDINVRSLVSNMRRNKSSGGYGLDGPARGTPARKLWEIARVAAADETHVPLTGVRGLIASQMKGAVGKSMLGGGAALGGMNAAGLLD